MKPPRLEQRAISVRRWSADDDAFVAALADEAFGEYGPSPSRYLLQVTHRAGIRAWLALEGEKPVGLVVLGRAASTWWVLAVAVTARARARGIGGRLMQIAEHHVAAHGGKRLS